MLARVKRGASRYLAATWAEIKSDWLLYACIAGYFIATEAFAFAIGEQTKSQPFGDVWFWIRMHLISLAIVAAPVAVINAVRHDRERPFSALLSDTRAMLGPRFAAGVVLIAAMGLYSDEFAFVKSILSQMHLPDWDVALANFDRVLHGGYDPGTLLTAALGHEGLPEIDFIYARVWIFLILAVTAWIATSRRYAHLRRRFFLTLFACGILLGNLGAALFYSVGPCFYGGLTGDHARFAQLMASLATTWSAQEQNYLWHFFSVGQVGLATGISAFPSMHLSYAAVVAIAMWSIDRRLAYVGIPYVILVQLGSVRLGWHYAIDGYAAIALSLLCWWAIGALDNLRKSARGQEIASDSVNADVRIGVGNAERQ